MSVQDELNPQPLPPRSVDVGVLTETVTLAINNALAQSKGRPLIVNPRIIIGIIAEPHLQQIGQGTGPGGTGPG